MAKILAEGCVVTCDYCNTKFSFELGEVTCELRTVPAGYSPEEEAYEKGIFSVECPKCPNSIRVDNLIGQSAKSDMTERAKSLKNIAYDDL